jgi:hypothetical protein
MAKSNKELRGIPAIYRTNFYDAVIFGAIQSQKLDGTEHTLDEIVRSVIKTFGLPMTPAAVKTSFIRTQRLFINGYSDSK